MQMLGTVFCTKAGDGSWLVESPPKRSFTHF